MGRFIAIRLLQFPLILAVIYLVTFLLVWVAPGDPFTRTDKKIDPAVIEATKKRLHAEHWYTFLAHYPVMMLKGDFGQSFSYEEWPVSKIIAVIIIITTGLSLAFGDTSGGFRRLIQIVFGLSIAFAASSFFLSFFSFGGGAVIG